MNDPAGYYEAITGQADGSDNRISDQQKQAARLIICANAVDAAEARDFMQMCGIHPHQVDDELEYYARTPQPINGGGNFNSSFTSS